MKRVYYLAFVRWFILAPNRQTRFYFQAGHDDKLCSVEIWTNNFYEIGRDCIIPIHNIFGKFIPSSYEIGKKNITKYIAVIPIGRKFHM